MLVKKGRELRGENCIFLIETSVLGGYFAIMGFSDYVLDIHGVAFDEVNYVDLPWYVPKVIYKRYIAFLEKFAIKRAAKVIVVSESSSSLAKHSFL